MRLKKYIYSLKDKWSYRFLGHYLMLLSGAQLSCHGSEKLIKATGQKWKSEVLITCCGGKSKSLKNRENANAPCSISLGDSILLESGVISTDVGVSSLLRSPWHWGRECGQWWEGWEWEGPLPSGVSHSGRSIFKGSPLPPRRRPWQKWMAPEEGSVPGLR